MANRETSYCINNFLVKGDIRRPRGFAYMRLLLDNFTIIKDVVDFLNENQYNARIKSLSACTIGQVENDITVKLQILFTVNEIADIERIKENIGVINGIHFSATLDEDVLYISDRFGCALEDCIAGFSNLEDSAHEIILMGGFWKKIINSIDKNIDPEVTNSILHMIGTEQGKYIASKLGKIILGEIEAVGEAQQTNDFSTIRIHVNQQPPLPDFKTNVETFFKGYGYGQIVLNINGTNIASISCTHSFFFVNDRETSFLEGFFSAFFTELLDEEYCFRDNGPFIDKDTTRDFVRI